MKKSIIFAIFLFSFSTFVWSQDFDQIRGLLWVKVESNEGIPLPALDGITTSNEQLNNVLRSANVSSIKQVFPTAKTESLRKIYAIQCDCDADELKNNLILFYNIYSNIRRRNEPILAYDPEDLHWQQDAEEKFWHLKIIEADLAWDITRGDPNIAIHIIDTGFDPTHPDLVTKFNDNFSNNGITPCFSQGLQWSSNRHSTAVAGFAAGETTEIGMTPNGGYASVGFNTRLVIHTTNDGLNKALVASQNGARIISISYFYGCSPDPDDEDVIQEILDNGTTIVAAAGNGAPHCDYGPTYPFSGVYDERVIQVTSTGRNDQHAQMDDGDTHSHYPEVDICAPGIDGLFACTPMVTCVQMLPTTGFVGGSGGTSYSAPIVAGTVALMLSVNPNLCNTEIQDIIKTTADPVTDAANYPGLVGAGRINAFNCVFEAKSRWEQDIHAPITANTTWSTDRFVNEELIVKTGATLTITSTVRFGKDARVVVERGARLIVDGGTLTKKECGPNEFWEGVKVHGKVNFAQPIDINGPLNSSLAGIVVLRNNATIEFANVGIATEYGMDDIPVALHHAYSGGLINCTNSNITNNKLAVKFTPYDS